MKPVSLAIALAVCAAAHADPVRALDILPPAAQIPLPANVRVFFRPQQNLEAALVAAIGTAHSEILVDQLALSNQAIGDALVRAYAERKVFLGIILDGHPPIKNYQGPAFLDQNHIPYVYAQTSGRNNHKYAVIDRRLVLVGSYDWTASADDNNEDLVAIDEPGVAAAFVRNWIEELNRARIPNIADRLPPAAAAPKQP